MASSHVSLEFRSQLDSLLSLLVRVPQMVLERVRQQHWQALELACEQPIAIYHKEIEQLAEEKVKIILALHTKSVYIKLH